MNAAEWAARFAARKRPTVPAQVTGRFSKAVGLANTGPRRNRPSQLAPSSIVQPGMMHRHYPILPPHRLQGQVSAVAGMVGGAGYTHSTAPGSQHHYTPKIGPGFS